MLALAATARPPTEFQCAGTRGLVLQDRWCDPAPCDCRDGSPHGRMWELSCLHPPPPPPSALSATAVVATAGSDGSSGGGDGRQWQRRPHLHWPAGRNSHGHIRRDGHPRGGEWAMPLPGVTGCALEFYSPSVPCAWTSLRRGLAPVPCRPAATPSPPFRPPTGALSAETTKATACPRDALCY